MINNKKVLAVIPARGGSKGIEKKNITPLGGKPLIAWTIEEALKVKEIDKLICSTDDDEIARVANKYKCETPFIRPKEIAGDQVSSIDTLTHAISWFKSKNCEFDYVMQLYCTSPFRKADSILSALRLFESRNASNLMSVHESPTPIYWALELDKNDSLKPVFDLTKANAQRQKLNVTYFPNGAICIAGVESLLQTKSFLTPTPIGFVLSKLESIDIDEREDLKYAEFLLNHL